jgi:hypothetical protein
MDNRDIEELERKLWEPACRQKRSFEHAGKLATQSTGSTHVTVVGTIFTAMTKTPCAHVIADNPEERVWDQDPASVETLLRN